MEVTIIEVYNEFELGKTYVFKRASLRNEGYITLHKEYILIERLKGSQGYIKGNNKEHKILVTDIKSVKLKEPSNL